MASHLFIGAFLERVTDKYAAGSFLFNLKYVKRVTVMVEPVKKAYDERAETYDEVFEKNFYKIYDEVTWRYLEPYLPKKRDAIVLDAGGGTGRWAIPMAKKGLNVVLVDISDGMLNVARKKVRAEGLEEKVTIRQGDITKLEYADEMFDLVFCEHTLFLIENKSAAIKELTRVLKRKCPLIIGCPNALSSILMSLKHDFPNYIDSSIDMLEEYGFTFKNDERKLGGIRARLPTPMEFRMMLEDNGLKVEKMVGKVVTILGWSEKYLDDEKTSQDLLHKLLKMELALCEKTDALGLAGHLQAIAYKK